MDEPTTISGYVEAVRAELKSLTARERDEALLELKALLEADAAQRGTDTALKAVGSPGSYARAVRLALGSREDDGALPQGRVLGMPYDFRPVTADRVGARIWNPADSRVFTPRLFGVGWTVNFGAIAVKLGLIRPDDVDDASFERVPPAAVRVALAIPAVLAAATSLLAALFWTRLPEQVPIHWGPTGAPDDWASKAAALGLLLAISVLPVALTYASVLRPATPARTKILSAAALSLLGAIGLGVMVMTIADADGGASGNWMWLVILGGLAVSFLELYVSARLGMRAEWRESLEDRRNGA